MEIHNSLLFLFIAHRYLHLRFDLGSGEINLQYNMTRINDGLWHRIRASRYNANFYPTFELYQSNRRIQGRVFFLNNRV